MANKVIVGAASLGIAGYCLNEQLKDRRAEQEANERWQQMEDHLEERRERMEQASMKRTGKRGRGSNESTDVDGLFVREFSNPLDSKLSHVLTRVQNAVEQQQHYKQLLHLPLLSDDSVMDLSEVLLGAALALSDPDSVQEALVRCNPGPGLALAKLSSEALSLIIQIFKSQRKPPTTNYDHIRPFLFFGSHGRGCSPR